jgi:tRNA(Ile)-lysidine synthase
MLGFEKKIADFIKANELFNSGDRVLLAVSGGADSIALLYTMEALKAEKVLHIELFCAHINHQLRGAEADNDERFVIEQAAVLNIPVFTRQVDVRGFARRNKLSIETAARKLRIENLLDIAAANNCNCIATGHQKNDNAETVLQRLSRGTGFRGLGGIRPVRVFDDKVKLVRPLLCVTRDEIITYLKEQNLRWRIDHTNADCTYRRNFIRHRLLPDLQQHNDSSIVEQLFSLSRSAQRFYDLVCSRVEKAWLRLAKCAGDKVEFDLRSFLLEPEPVKVELIRRSLTCLGSGERDLSQKHYEKILRLSKQNISGKQIELPGGFKAHREYGNLIFYNRRVGLAPPSSAKAKAITVEIPGRTQFGQYLIEATIFDAGCSMLDARRKTKSRIENRESRIKFVERFDLDKVKPPLVVRSRQDGDRFWPLGLKAEKKIGKFLTAEKVPQEIRRKVFVVADVEKIIWVWPIRISGETKITDETQKILQLQIFEVPKVS